MRTFSQRLREPKHLPRSFNGIQTRAYDVQPTPRNAWLRLAMTKLPAKDRKFQVMAWMPSPVTINKFLPLDVSLAFKMPPH